MAQKRIKSGLLAMAKHFAALKCPVYLLDETRVILYCNDTCESWTGVLSEQLLGRQISFHSSDDDPLSGITAGLCPPPDFFSRGECASAIVGFRRENGETTRRRARFLPLGETGENFGLLAIVDSHELPAGADVPQESSIAERTHDQLRQLRSQWQRRYRLDRLVGSSLVSLRVREQVKLAIDSRARTVIVGPPGSGREHVARTIHAARPDAADNLLLPLPSSLLDADLLRASIESLFQKRNVGPVTLLLLDADQLNAETQLELVRWLAASRHDVATLVTARRSLLQLDAEVFRQDLAYQLSPLVIELPSLAARTEDIPLVAQMFLEEMNRAGGKQMIGFSPDVLKQLISYPWPNNLDELATVVADAAAHAEGALVTLADLPSHLRLAADAAARPTRSPAPIILDEFLISVEKELIQRALQRCKGNKAKAARLLGISRPRLHRRMEQLKLE